MDNRSSITTYENKIKDLLYEIYTIKRSEAYSLADEAGDDRYWYQIEAMLEDIDEYEQIIKDLQSC